MSKTLNHHEQLISAAEELAEILHIEADLIEKIHSEQDPEKKKTLTENFLTHVSAQTSFKKYLAKQITGQAGFIKKRSDAFKKNASKTASKREKFAISKTVAKPKIRSKQKPNLLKAKDEHLSIDKRENLSLSSRDRDISYTPSPPPMAGGGGGEIGPVGPELPDVPPPAHLPDGLRGILAGVGVDVAGAGRSENERSRSVNLRTWEINNKATGAARAMIARTAWEHREAGKSPFDGPAVEKWLNDLADEHGPATSAEAAKGEGVAS